MPSDALGVLLTGGEIWGTHGAAPGSPATNLRGKVLGAMAAHNNPSVTPVSDTNELAPEDVDALAQKLTGSIIAENLVLHPHETAIRTGLSLSERGLGQQAARVVMLVASPCVLGGAEDAEGRIACHIVTRAIAAIYTLASGVYVFDGGPAPIPVAEAALVEGWFVRKLP